MHTVGAGVPSLWVLVKASVARCGKELLRSHVVMLGLRLGEGVRATGETARVEAVTIIILLIL